MKTVMASNNIQLSIIIINFNTKNLTKECIASIYKHMGDLHFEVIVIDNASVDGSKEELSNLGFPDYIYVYNSKNLGFSKANNQAASIAHGEYLFFMNSDMLFINDVAGILIDYYNQDEKVGIMGPKFLNPDGSLQISCRNFPTIKFGLLKFFPFIKKFQKKEYLDYYQKKRDFNIVQKVDTVSAGALLIKKELFDEIGGFDEISFMYGEDADVCKRVRDLGKDVIYYPEAMLIHYGGQSSKLNSYKAIYSYYMAFYHLYKKYYFGAWAILFKPLFFFRAWIELLFNLFRKDKRLTWTPK
jgi:GT2 family glycosyltransferase